VLLFLGPSYLTREPPKIADVKPSLIGDMGGALVKGRLATL